MDYLGGPQERLDSRGRARVWGTSVEVVGLGKWEGQEKGEGRKRRRA